VAKRETEFQLTVIVSAASLCTHWYNCRFTGEPG